MYFVILQYQSVLKSSPRTFLSQFKFHADIDFNTAYKITFGIWQKIMWIEHIKFSVTNIMQYGTLIDVHMHLTIFLYCYYPSIRFNLELIIDAIDTLILRKITTDVKFHLTNEITTFIIQALVSHMGHPFLLIKQICDWSPLASMSCFSINSLFNILFAFRDIFQVRIDDLTVR